MVFGHNTNLKVGNITFHIQTEDRGQTHALIDTTVYYYGRVLHRRTNNYFDLLPMDKDREYALKLRLDEQHRTVLEEIREGILQLAIPEIPEPPKVAILPQVQEPRNLFLELSNSKSWLLGKRATLLISVKQENGEPVPGAQVIAGIEGAAEPGEYRGETRDNGQVQIEFEMPRLANAEAALVIRAENQHAKGHLRFALRAKPRVPAV
jgi:hypothetical protein